MHRLGNFELKGFVNKITEMDENSYSYDLISKIIFKMFNSWLIISRICELAYTLNLFLSMY